MGDFGKFRLSQEATLLFGPGHFSSPDVDTSSSGLVETDVDSVEVVGLAEEGDDLFFDFGPDAVGFLLGVFLFGVFLFGRGLGRWHGFVLVRVESSRVDA